MNDCIVIGAGASGLAAAISAARKGISVTVLEHNGDSGKKILVTGSGKCNYLNEDFTIQHYRSSDNTQLSKIINDKNKELIKGFFSSIGILPKIKNGYYYPNSQKAVSLLSSLKLEAKNLNINFIHNIEVKKIEYSNKIKVITNDGEFLCKDLIIATGSCASPKTGSTGSGYNMLKELGYKINKPLPALVQLIGNDSYYKQWSGIRTDVENTLVINNKEIRKSTGEIMLTEYGISGICVFDLSGTVNNALNNQENVSININFLPLLKIYDKKNLKVFLEKRNKELPNRNIVELLEGILDYKLLNVILKISNLSIISCLDELTESELDTLAANLISFKFIPTSSKNFDSAQVATGGLPLDNININTFELLNHKHIYVIGELLDVDGDCGGYNLGFAWLSGILAGNNIGGSND